MLVQLEHESETKSNVTGTLISIRLSVKTIMRIWSSSQTGKAAILKLRKLRPDLSVQNLVQNRNQRLRC
jgi:hypothetical protein